jgi:hypothetical protein
VLVMSLGDRVRRVDSPPAAVVCPGATPAGALPPRNAAVAHRHRHAAGDRGVIVCPANPGFYLHPQRVEPGGFRRRQVLTCCWSSTAWARYETTRCPPPTPVPPAPVAPPVRGGVVFRAEPELPDEARRAEGACRTTRSHDSRRPSWLNLRP